MIEAAGVARQRGVGLVEVMIAVLVLSIGLLGLAGLQGVSLRNTLSAYERSVATSLAYDMIDAIRADRLAVMDDDWDLVGCGPELAAFQARAGQLLPGGTLTCAVGTNRVQVNVQWVEDRTDEDGDGSTTRTFSVVSRI